jgi:signal transduction histidine kinase
LGVWDCFPEMRGILGKLLLAYVVPSLALFGLFGFLALEVARRSLDEELGARLGAPAAAATTHVRAQYLLDMTPSHPPPQVYTYTQGELRALAAATQVERVSVFKPDLTSLCDTREGVPIGVMYHELELDRHELARVTAGETAASVLYRGTDGRWRKAGYAPLRDKDGQVVAGLRVEAPAGTFEALAALRRQLLAVGIALAAATVAASILMAALLTRPLRRLASAAKRIGRGELDTPVATHGRDEIALLSRTLDEMRRSLRARDERQGMMLAGIAHEVRNPLAGIDLYAGILREELVDNPEQRRHVARIERELDHLSLVVEDFLAYARRGPPELRPVELRALLGEVAELVAGSEVIVVVDGVQGDDVKALADRAHLRRALLNLARNAVQATPAGGRVRLSVRRDGDRARIDVTDTGLGIPAAEREKIFAPFYSTKDEGVGLGLAFVKEIVDEHGGTLEVVSEVDRGTTFTLWLPWA